MCVCGVGGGGSSCIFHQAIFGCLGGTYRNVFCVGSISDNFFTNKNMQFFKGVCMMVKQNQKHTYLF